MKFIEGLGAQGTLVLSNDVALNSKFLLKLLSFVSKM